ncbi:MFS transporter [Chelativorans sp. YIM 93263]|uniref:MFS transporter n=1 Tax=Chelativorans sp. YIM 93263 TaxID=2906648 RepID=UPI002378C9FB|nr:MFS transporter [Chelativorans sp. YIM 93263]
MRTPLDDLGTASGVRPVSTAARNATLLLLSALTIMAGATISPALPAIEAYFAGTPNAAILTRLVLTIPALFIALCAPFAGILADRYGRRPVAIATVLLYGLSGLSGIVLDSLTGMLIGRALLGIAVAGIMTTATALIGDYFSGSARDRFMGLQAAFMGLGGLFFLTGGGILAELHWRAPFLVYAVAFALLPALVLFIREPVRTVAPVEHGKRERALGPIITLPLAVVLAAAVINSVVFYLMPTQLPFHLQTLSASTPIITGATLGAMTLASSIMSLLYGRVRQRIGVSSIFAVGFAATAAGFTIVALANTSTAVIPGAVIVGGGLGLIMPNLGSAAMGLAAENNRGRVAGMLTACIFVGQFASPLISQPLIDQGGYPMAFGLGAGAILCAALIALGIAATYRVRQVV